MRVKFYGVRGSTPCSCESNQRIGGNTACVVVTGDGFDPIVLDLGTGLRFWGTDVCSAAPEAFRATALVSHLHWDHVQGLPFFPPLHKVGSELHVIGPAQNDHTLEEAFDLFLCPPYFPVTLGQLAGKVTFQEATSEPIQLGSATVTARDVPHVGPTLGFRIEAGGVSIAYVSDHQQPGCLSTEVADSVLELCDGVDLLIHDAQYTDPEFAQKFDWGHCTTDYAVEVAQQSGAKRLALYHHDPSHDDDTVEELATKAAALKGGTTGDWSEWADCFTEDCTYKEHLYGEIGGRAAVLKWITEVCADTYPGNEMPHFPIEWHIVDEDRGWIICQVWNRMSDPGDGSIWQEYNFTLLKYAGNHLFSYEEDIYNPAAFGKMLAGWEARRDKIAKKSDQKSDQQSDQQSAAKADSSGG